MTTSANSIEYDIMKNGEVVGHFRKNVLCRLPEFSDLLKYQPLEDHTILPYGYDEEEDEWFDEEQNLKDFLYERKLYCKGLKEYFLTNP
jgi:hypothetical protein